MMMLLGVILVAALALPVVLIPAIALQRALRLFSSAPADEGPAAEEAETRARVEGARARPFGLVRATS